MFIINQFYNEIILIQTIWTFPFNTISFYRKKQNKFKLF